MFSARYASIKNARESRKSPSSSRTISDVRAPARFRLLLPALGVPLCIAVLGVGIQAAAFERPSRSSLIAADALRELMRYRVMRGTELVSTHRIGSLCVQGWFRTPRGAVSRGALVLLSDGTRLYDFGHGVRRYGGIPASPADRTRFLLAGCPRVLDSRFASRLVRGIGARTVAVRADGANAYAIRVGRSALEIYVARGSLRPVRLRLGPPFASGSSDLEPGGSSVVAKVRNAFRFEHQPHRRHV